MARDVKLPDGRTVAGVPDHISDQDVLSDPRYKSEAPKKIMVSPDEQRIRDEQSARIIQDELNNTKAGLEAGAPGISQADVEGLQRELARRKPPMTPEAVEAGAPPSTGPSPEVMADDAAKRELLQKMEQQRSAGQPAMDRMLGQGLGGVVGGGVGAAMQTNQLVRAGINALRQPPEAPRVEPTINGPLTSGQKWLQNWAGHTEPNPNVTSVPEAAALHNRQVVGHGKVSGRISKMYPQRPGQPNSIFERMGPTPEPPASPPMATPRTRAALDAVTDTFRTATQPFAATSRIGTQVVPTLGMPIAGIGVGGGAVEMAQGIKNNDPQQATLGGLEAVGSLASVIPKLARLGIPLTMAIEAYRALKDPADRARLHEMMFGRTEPDKPI